MILLHIEIDDAKAQEFFNYAGYKIRDAREPLRDTMLQVVWPAIRDQLASEGRRSGNPWPELSDKYREWKELNHGSLPILYLEGDMWDALFDRNAYRVTRERLTYHPQNDYAHWHQEGGYIEGRPPQRTIIDLIPEDYDEIDMIFQDWLDELRTTNRARGTSVEFQSGPSIDILGI